MRFFSYLLTTTLLFLSLSVSFSAVAEEVLYKADFEDIEIGEVPDDFLVLEGKFAVDEDQGNKILVLPGQPVGTFTTLMSITSMGTCTGRTNSLRKGQSEEQNSTGLKLPRLSRAPRQAGFWALLLTQLVARSIGLTGADLYDVRIWTERVQKLSFPD